MRQVVRYLGVRLVCRMSLHLNILCKKFSEIRLHKITINLSGDILYVFQSKFTINIDY